MKTSKDERFHILSCAVQSPGIKLKDVNVTWNGKHQISRDKRARHVFELRGAGLLKPAERDLDNLWTGLHLTSDGQDLSNQNQADEVDAKCRKFGSDYNGRLRKRRALLAVGD